MNPVHVVQVKNSKNVAGSNNDKLGGNLEQAIGTITSIEELQGKLDKRETVIRVTIFLDNPIKVGNFGLYKAQTVFSNSAVWSSRRAEFLMALGLPTTEWVPSLERIGVPFINTQTEVNNPVNQKISLLVRTEQFGNGIILRITTFLPKEKVNA